jgi:hypothetical protein
MPRIPIYNLQVQVQGQAGSTSVVQIPQSATSGAIASVADTTSKALSDIAKFGNVIIDNESKRIATSEQIKYKTQLTTIQQNIQKNFPLNPEIWMDEFEKEKTSLIGQINTTDYKYDFLKRNVINQLELDYLPLRNNLFTKFVESNKKLNLIGFEENAMIGSNALGEAVMGAAEDFEYEQKNILAQLMGYSAYGSADKSIKLQTEVYTNAFRIGLERVYAGNKPYFNSQLTMEKILNASDDDISGLVNLKKIISFLDDDDARAVLEKFTDNENETFKRNQQLETEVIAKQKLIKDNLLYLLYTTKDDEERNNVYQQLNKLASNDISVFDTKELNTYRNWYEISNQNGVFDPPSNPFGNEQLTATLLNQINEFSMTFDKLQEYFPQLNKAQQKELVTEWKGNRKEQKADFRNRIKTEFGLGAGDGFIILGGEQSEAQQVITQATALAISKFNIAVANDPNINFKQIVPEIIKETKADLKESIRMEMMLIIDKFDQYFEPGEVTPENFNSKYKEKYEEIVKGGDQNQLTFYSKIFRNNKEIINIWRSYDSSK